METVLPSEFKRGMVLLLENAPHVIEQLQSSGTAKFKPKLHVRLRHLTTGRVLDRTFADNEQVPVADLENRSAQFSYKEAETYFEEALKTRRNLVLADELIEEVKAYQILSTYLRGDRERALDMMATAVHLFTEVKIRRLPLEADDKEMLRKIIRDYLRR